MCALQYIIRPTIKLKQTLGKIKNIVRTKKLHFRTKIPRKFKLLFYTLIFRLKSVPAENDNNNKHIINL